MAWISVNATTRRPDDQSSDHLDIVAIQAALLPGDGNGKIAFFGGPGLRTNITSTPRGFFDMASRTVSSLEGAVPQR